MSTDTQFPSSYTTFNLRKKLGEALGQAHYNDSIVRITHHTHPHAAIVSNQAADFLDFLQGGAG